MVNRQDKCGSTGSPRMVSMMGVSIENWSYEKLKAPGAFSEELLQQALWGLSGRKYEETVVAATDAFGGSPRSAARSLRVRCNALLGDCV
ncbi:MAG: hypothetical protein HY037_01615 [Nitrospirae bacterium]|nr:hypothetical protein [Candidatus Troglogloeales bacterium]